MKIPVIVLVVAVLLFGVAPSGSAAATNVYELPPATHAGPLAVSGSGTVWFIPERGHEWQGNRSSNIGSVGPEGTVSEETVPGIRFINDVAAGLDGEVWVSGFDGSHDLFGERRFEVGLLTPTGGVVDRYSVGNWRGRLRSLAVSGRGVWFIAQRLTSNGVDTIVRVGAGGARRRFGIPPKCRAGALAAAPDGTVWFSEKCGGFVDGGATSKTSLTQIRANGTMVRHRIAGRDAVVSLTVGKEGTVWFGACCSGLSGDRLGRLGRNGGLREFATRNALPRSLAAGPGGVLSVPWFHHRYPTRLASIGLDGKRDGPRVCADPTCDLEPQFLTSAPDGSIWFGLRRPNYNTGGGGSGLYIDEQIGDEAGFIGHYLP